MPEKLLTLEELASYLGVKEEVVIKLVDEGVITAYKVGGEFLRFRKDHIDAVFSEIRERISGSRPVDVSEARLMVQEFHDIFDGGQGRKVPISDKIHDFFYFYDFYIVSGAIILGLVLYITRT